MRIGTGKLDQVQRSSAFHFRWAKYNAECKESSVVVKKYRCMIRAFSNENQKKVRFKSNKAHLSYIHSFFSIQLDGSKQKRTRLQNRVRYLGLDAVQNGPKRDAVFNAKSTMLNAMNLVWFWKSTNEGSFIRKKTQFGDGPKNNIFPRKSTQDVKSILKNASKH